MRNNSFHNKCRWMRHAGMHWFNIKNDALEVVKSCQQCMQHNVGKKGYYPLKSIEADRAGDHWAIDLAGPFPTTHQGNHYL